MRLKTNMIRMSAKRKLYHVLSKIGSLFSGMQFENFEIPIQQSLEWIGELLKVDRIYIYKYNFKENTCSNLFEYYKIGIEPMIDQSQNLSLKDAKDWVEAHQSFLPTYIPNINKHHQFLGLRELLLSQGVKSLFTIPLNLKGELYGFLGFDSVLHYRKYSKFERYVLQEYANILTRALERIDLEKKLYDSQQELEVVFQAIKQSPNAVIITDSMSNILYVNPKFEEITGFTTEEVIGENPRIQQSGIHTKEFYQIMYQTMNEGKNWIGELYNKRKDGTYYWEAASMSAVFDKKGQVTHYISIKSDISKRKQQEEALAVKRIELERDVANKIVEIEDSQHAAIIALAKLTESRDLDTGRHVERVQHLSRILAKQLKNSSAYQHQISDLFIKQIYYASALHDIGKISIPDSILLKQDHLSKEEYNIMKTHVTIGEKILSDMIKFYPNSELVKLGREIARYHHEKWDGSGYTEGISGEHIPLSARIMAIVDVYDALRSKRPYKNKMTHTKTCQMILKESGKHFDPIIVENFMLIHSKFDDVFNKLSEDENKK